MSKEEIIKNIEALLYYTGTSLKRNAIAKILDVSKEEVNEAIEEIKNIRESSGIILIETEDAICLGTSNETKKVIEEYTKSEMKGTIGRAGAETLSIIAYIGPVTKTTIEYIRGVHSQFILQRLLLRGLIKKRGEGRKAEYLPTVDLFAYMGVKTKEELPDYEETKSKLLEVLEKRENRMKDKNEGQIL